MLLSCAGSSLSLVDHWVTATFDLTMTRTVTMTKINSKFCWQTSLVCVSFSQHESEHQDNIRKLPKIKIKSLYKWWGDWVKKAVAKEQKIQQVHHHCVMDQVWGRLDHFVHVMGQCRSTLEICIAEIYICSIVACLHYFALYIYCCKFILKILKPTTSTTLYM